MANYKKFDWNNRGRLILFVIAIVIGLGLIILWTIDKNWLWLVIGVASVFGWFAFVQLYLKK